MVGIEKMAALITMIAMHTVRVDHKVKLLTLLVQCIQKQKSILMMHIVITCTMSQLEHDIRISH